MEQPHYGLLPIKTGRSGSKIITHGFELPFFAQQRRTPTIIGGLDMDLTLSVELNLQENGAAGYNKLLST